MRSLILVLSIFDWILFLTILPRDFDMKKLWKLAQWCALFVAQHGALPIGVFLVGTGSLISGVSIGAGVGTNTSQQSSSVSSEGNSNSDFVVTLASRELTEGSHKSQFLSGGEPMVWPADNDWPDSEVVVGEYEPTLIPLEFSLANPFSSNITATVEFDAENSDCAKPLPLTKKGVVSINSGVTNFAIDAALFPDNYPEDDCNARFKIIFDDGVNKKTIVAKGAIRVLDDDKGVGDVVTTDQLYPGQYFDWPLNGARRYDGSDIVVTQIKGPTTEFKVDKHQLKLIVPGVEPGSIADRTVILSVQPEKSAAYKISFLIRAGFMEPLSVEDATAGDSDYDTGYVNFYKDAKVYGYHRGYIPSKTLTDLKWVIETASPENRVVLDKNSTMLAFRGGGFDIATEDEDKIYNLLQLLPDNRTLVLNPAYIAILQKYLDDGRVPYIQWEVKIFQNNVISEDDEIEGQYYNHQKIQFTSWIRPAPRKALVTILGLDAKQIRQSNLRMAIVQQSNPDQITQYKSVENVKTEFDFLVQGSYSVSVIDIDKGEIANGIFTLDDKTTEVDYHLELRELPSSLERAK